MAVLDCSMLSLQETLVLGYCLCTEGLRFLSLENHFSDQAGYLLSHQMNGMLFTGPERKDPLCSVSLAWTGFV